MSSSQRVPERNRRREQSMPMCLTDSLELDEPSKRHFINKFPVFYQFITRFWSPRTFYFGKFIIYLFGCRDDISILYCNPPRYFQFFSLPVSVCRRHLWAFDESSLFLRRDSLFDVCIQRNPLSDLFVGCFEDIKGADKLK